MKKQRIINTLEFSSNDIELMTNDILEGLRASKHKIVDMTDLGFSLGVTIAKYISTNHGFELLDFIQGIQDGVLLECSVH